MRRGSTGGSHSTPPAEERERGRGVRGKGIREEGKEERREERGRGRRFVEYGQILTLPPSHLSPKVPSIECDGAKFLLSLLSCSEVLRFQILAILPDTKVHSHR